MDEIEEIAVAAGVLPRSALNPAMPPGAAVPPADLPKIPARDALNLIGGRLAQETTALMNGGVDPQWIIAMHVDHLAGIIALYEPRQHRNAELAAAVERIKSLTAQKVVKRREVDKERGIVKGGLRP